MGFRNSLLEKGLLIFTLALTVILWLCQLSVFDGVATLDAGGHLPLSNPWWLLQVQPLSILGFPICAVAALFAAAGIAMALVGSRDRTDPVGA
jgi:hypothetical protein